MSLAVYFITVIITYVNQNRATYEPPEWEARERFINLLDTTCAALGVRCDWLSDNWIARLEHAGRITFVYGYTFPLNNASSSAIMRDKAATYTVLHNAGVAAIPHHLLRLRAHQDMPAATGYALGLAPLPLVLKPNVGESGGYDVVKCTTQDELATSMRELASRHRVLAVSPFAQIQRECRVVVLDGQPKVVYEKLRQPGTWHHNLTLGATPQLITDTVLRKKLERFATTALGAIQGRLAAVDIVETPVGWQVMEINSGIAFDRFSAQSDEYASIARNIYGDIIRASLGI